MGDSLPFQGNTGKRKRSNDEDDYASDSDGGEGLFVTDTDDDSDLEYCDSDDDYNYETDNNIEDDIQSHEENETNATVEDEIPPSMIDPDAIYSERGEPYPNLAAYDEAIPKIKDAYTGIAQQVVKIIQTNPCNSAVLAKFLAKSSDLTAVPTSKSVKIALLGETGVGKSSLLNSVIDIPDLARAFGGGESCTCVSTEYRNAFPGQVKRFAARVVYLDRLGVTKLIKNSIDSYYDFYYAEKEFETLDQDTLNQERRRAETAITTFCALFRQHAEFENYEAGEKYLHRMAKNDRNDVIFRLQEWAMDILKEQKTASGASNEFIEADDQHTFAELTGPMLNSDFRTDGVCLWPLVKCVSIGIKGSRVLENVTIADLPGVTDTDTLKVNHALDYMRDCQAIWIVATEERYRGKITIIATRSDDDVKTSLAKGLRDKHISIKGYDKQLALQKKAQLQVSETKTTIRNRLKAKSSKERNEKVKKLRSEVTVHKESFKEASENKFVELVKARNGHVISSMSENFKRHCPKGSMPRIICVSNLHYWTLKGVEDRGKFQLQAEDTGIPALRKIVYKLAAPGLLRSLDDYIKFDFTVFCKGTNLWALSRYVPGAKELLSVVEKLQTLMASNIEKYRDEMQATIEKMILEPLVSKVTKHSSEAIDMLELKRKHRHPATLKAFMRKGGNHRTANCPRESWNEQFLQGPSTVLNKSWDKTKKLQDKLLSTLKRQITDEVANMLETIKEDQRANRLELTSFEQMVAGQIRGIKNAFRDHQAAFHQELENIKLDATQDRHTGYFTSAMYPAYEKCREDYGPGTVQRCLGYVTAQLSLKDDKCPFFQNASLIADTMTKLAKEQNKEVESRLREILVDVYEHFDGMIASEFEDPSETPVRVALKNYMKDAGKRVGELNAELAAVKEKYNKVIKADTMDDTAEEDGPLNKDVVAGMKKMIKPSRLNEQKRHAKKPTISKTKIAKASEKSKKMPHDQTSK